MTMRIASISGAVALVLSASTASAQAKTQQIILSKGVVKSMTANKTKSKTPLGERAGIVRKPSVEAGKSAPAAPTSVRETIPARK